jgi:5-methylcytosine-specific restriction endonuclease McrA
MGRHGRTRKESHWHDGQPSGYDWIGRSSRLAIYMRDGFKCLACGYTAERGSAFTWSGLTLDHLDTNKRGSDPTNLVTLCLSCNSSRRATDPATWDPVFAEIAYFQVRKPLDRKAALALAKQTWPARYEKDASRSRQNREKKKKRALEAQAEAAE